MKVSVLLADKGTPDRGRGTLNLLNAGWTRTTLQPPQVLAPGMPALALTPPHAVAVFYDLEPRHCNRPIELVIELLTEDGQPVSLPGPAGPQEMTLRQQITVASPGGVPSGTPGTGNTLIEIGPGLPLAPGGYEWRVTLAGEHEESWSALFRVAPQVQAPTLAIGPTSPPESDG